MAEKPYYIRVWSDRVCDEAERIDDDDTDLPAFCRDQNRRMLLGQQGQDGVEAKEWVRYKDEPWLAKTGNAQLGPIALPIHEAIASFLYSFAGLRVNEVSLGSRKLHGWAQMLGFVPISLHRFASGNQRQFYADDYAFTDAFTRDYAVMSALDVVFLQGDRHKGNYMVLEDKNLFVIDNGRAFCFQDHQPLDVNEFENLQAGRFPNREGRAWDDDAREAVTAALMALTNEALRAAFDAVPRVWAALHDAQSGPTAPHPAQRMTIAEKEAIVKSRLYVAQNWALST